MGLQHDEKCCSQISITCTTSFTFRYLGTIPLLPRTLTWQQKNCEAIYHRIQVKYYGVADCFLSLYLVVSLSLPSCPAKSFDLAAERQVVTLESVYVGEALSMQC